MTNVDELGEAVRLLGKPDGDPREERGWWGPDGATVLLVGEAPGRRLQESGRPHLALVREDLADLCGVRYPDGFVRTFARTNVLRAWPGKQGRGDAFPLRAARDAAVELAARCFHRFRRVVLLGRRVESAFAVLLNDRGSVAPWPWFAWRNVRDPSCPPTEVAVAPHPSRASSWWNDASNVASARAFWRELAAFAAEGVR